MTINEIIKLEEKINKKEETIKKREEVIKKKDERTEDENNMHFSQGKSVQCAQQ
jgi:hypothetical protein